MVSLFHIACVSVWSVLVIAQTLQSPSRVAVRRAAATPKTGGKFKADFIRLNNGVDVLLKPIVGKMFPYFNTIAFQEPCMDKTKIKISIDTGSSDTWLDSSAWCDCPKVTENTYRQCAKFKSLKDKNTTFRSLKYDDGFVAKGNFMNTTLVFDKTIVEGMFLLAAWDFDRRPKGANDMSGSIGLGYSNDQTIKVGNKDTFNTLPEVLETNGITTSNAYSMWFSNKELTDDFSGSILFGGYVSNFYEGDLSTFKSADEPGIVIPLDEINFNNKPVFDSCKAKEAMRVMLDTGSYSSYLPSDIFEELLKTIGSHTFVENEVRQIAVFDNCDAFNWTKPLLFRFGNTMISVPLGSVVRRPTDAEVTDETYRTIKNAKKQCISHGIATWPGEAAKDIVAGFTREVKLSKSTSKRAILGVTLLRYAYMVYDIPQREISIAAINSSAVKEGSAQDHTFNDKTVHQKQKGFKPVKAVTLSCPHPQISS